MMVAALSCVVYFNGALSLKHVLIVLPHLFFAHTAGFFLCARIYCIMEILMLVLLYYLSQNPNFSESVKPLMSQLKDSEQMLSFLKDLSKFSDTFSAFKADPPKQEKQDKTPPKKENAPPRDETKKENPQSPTTGIADEFIQKILDSYLQKR